MAETTLYDTAANRYAEAAFAIARDNGTYDQWREDLADIAELVQHPQAGPFLASGSVSDADKRRMLTSALRDMQPLAMNMALLLLQRGRLAAAPRIAEAYARRLDMERGIVQAEVTTAVPLTPDDERAIADRLKSMVGALEVRLTSRVDPSVIGGMIARVGDTLIDGSTRTRLVQLKRSLAGESR